MATNGEKLKPSMEIMSQYKLDLKEAYKLCLKFYKGSTV